MRYGFRSIIASASLLAFAGSALADGTLTGEIEVQVIIGSGCTVSDSTSSSGTNSWGTLDFGEYTDLTNAVDAQVVGTTGSTFSVTCSSGLTASLALDGGENSDGTLRQMVYSSDNYIPYRLYSDSTRSSELAIDGAISLTADGTEQSVGIYGRILPGDQSTTAPEAGTYVDTVLATLSW